MSVIPKARKIVVWNRDDYTCFYCKVKVIQGHWSPDRFATVDHKVALKNGGTNNLENLVTSCQRCNSKKGHLKFELFVEYMQDQRILWKKFYKQMKDAGLV